MNHAQQSVSRRGRRGGSARRGPLRRRECAARGLGGVEQAGGRKTHLSRYPKEGRSSPESIVVTLTVVS